MNRRRRRLASAALVAAFTIGAVGCSLGFHPSDYEDDTDETDGAPPRDGGSGLDASASDAAADASLTGDATNPGQDASNDAPADGPTLRFCQRVMDAAFCSDFDEAGSVDQDWFGNDTVIKGGASLIVDTTFLARSLPGSAYASIIPLRQDAAEGAGAYLVKNLATAPREVILDFDFSVEQLSGDHLTFVSLYFLGNETRGMYLALDDNSTSKIGLVAVSNLYDASAWTFSDFDYPVDSGVPWNHITIDMVVVPGGAGTLTASVNGAVEQPLSTLNFDPDTAADTLQLTLGLQRADKTVTPQMDVHFDNVVVTYR